MIIGWVQAFIFGKFVVGASSIYQEFLEEPPRWPRRMLENRSVGGQLALRHLDCAVINDVHSLAMRMAIRIQTTLDGRLTPSRD